MTTMSIPLPGYGEARVSTRLPAFRRLVLSTGLALVTWSSKSSNRSTHEQQALRMQAETSRRRAAEGFRYGIAQ